MGGDCAGCVWEERAEWVVIVLVVCGGESCV